VSGWSSAARQAIERGPTALVTVLQGEGSVPRDAGSRMVVTRAATYATIGGGRLEWQAIQQARAILERPPGEWRVQDYPLGPLLGQCCGGRVRLLVEHLDPRQVDWLDGAEGAAVMISHFEAGQIRRELRGAPSPAGKAALPKKPEVGDEWVERIDRPSRRVLLFGAGHVGQAVARAAKGLPLQLDWFDSRADMARDSGARFCSEDELTVHAGQAPADAAIVILTHDHGLDYRLVAAALRSPAAYVGLIGSKTKRARFVARLARDGVDFSRLTCPIGLPSIAGKEPEVIAISLLAQLLALGPTPAPGETDAPPSAAAPTEWEG
jgi:xanthine dehydrogenase accessory factor